MFTHPMIIGEPVFTLQKMAERYQIRDDGVDAVGDYTHIAVCAAKLTNGKSHWLAAMWYDVPLNNSEKDDMVRDLVHVLHEEYPVEPKAEKSKRNLVDWYGDEG